MGGTLGVWLGPRSGNSDVSSWVKTEQNWSPMMLALLRLSEKVSPSFFKGATLRVKLLSTLFSNALQNTFTVETNAMIADQT